MMRTPFGPVHLPPEYRMQWVEGEFRLSDAGGNLLFVLPARPGALADLEKYAWQHAWRQMEKEVRRELQQLRDGTLTIKELRRMRQYLRLLEALAEEAPQATPKMTFAARVGMAVRSLPRPRPRAAALAFAGGVAAGLLAFVLLSANQMTPPSPMALAPSQQVDTTAQPAPSARARPSPGEPSNVGRAVRKNVAPSGKPESRVAGYATVFGRFTSAEAARVRARLVRTKGYVAKVVPAGEAFRVLGRIYTTRSDAERMARILRQIGLPASVQPVGL